MNKKIESFLWGLMALLVLSSPVSGQQKSTDNGNFIPNDPSVKIGKLSNGLTYYIRKNTEPKKRAELYLANKVGSLLENDDQRGLAHFTEHMAFNGTRDFPKNQIIDYLQKAGVRFGADLNANTGFDQTIYQLPIPTDSAALFRTGFKILSNWAGRMTMNGAEIDRERGVIIEEDRQRGKNAQDRMSKQLYPVLLKDSRYAIRMPIGKVDLLKSFTYDKIRSFYADWYRPDLQAVIAVGDFDVKEVEKLIIANFSDLKNPVKEKKRAKYGLNDNIAPLIRVVTDPEQQYNVAAVTYKRRVNVTKTRADIRKSLMYSMINEMLSARFQEIMQKGNAPFLFAQSSYGAYQGGIAPNYDAFGIQVAAKSGKELQTALAAAVAESDRAVRFGFLPTELEVIKRNIEAENEQGLKEKDKTSSAAFVQQYVDHFLTGAPIPSIDFSYAAIKEDLGTISLADVNALAKTLVTSTNEIITVQAPEKDKALLPTPAQLLAIVADAGDHLVPYVDHIVNTPLLAQIPTAGKVIAEKKMEGIGTTEWTLSNGIRVLLKPTDFKNDQVIFSSFGKGGTSVADPNDFQSADFSALIPGSGLAGFNPTQLDKLLAGNTGRAGAYIDNLYQGFSGSSSPKDLETAFKMVYVAALNPRRDSEIFNKSISDYKISLENKNADPESVFADTVQAVLSSYNKRSMPTTPADLEKVNLDKSFAFYKSRFADLGEQTFVIVGNFTLDNIKPLVETYIASLPSLHQQQAFVDIGDYPPKGVISKTVYKGLEDKASVQLYLHGDYDFTAENNVQLEALKNALENKVLERLRKKESGVYTPEVGLSVSKYPTAHYYFIISFSCAKANVEKLIAAALEEVQTIKTNGATEEEITKFKSEEHRQMELNLRNNSYWLNYLTNRIKYGEDVNLVLSSKERVDDVNVLSTKIAAQKYLNESNYIRLVLLPQQQEQVRSK